MEYTEFQHKHNFAVWAGARATQRGFTDVKLLKCALEKCGVTSFSKDYNSITNADDFNKNHKEWCTNICNYLNCKGVQKVTYGRAAKLIAVYLKSIIVLPNINTLQAGFIHPPIDRILLQNLSRHNTVTENNSRILKNTKWTTLDETKYNEVLTVILEINENDPNWKIEKFWTVTND